MAVGDAAFWNCWKLTAITIPNGVIRIGNNAFRATGLAQMHIPASVTEIGDFAFYDCAFLTNFSVDPVNAHFTTQDGFLLTADRNTVVLCPPGKTGALSTPPGVAAIGPNAFFGSRLGSISISEGVTSIGRFAFGASSLLTSVTIPSSVSILDEGAFATCEKLPFIAVPSGVTTIGAMAFITAPASPTRSSAIRSPLSAARLFSRVTA